jgi:hypothetical protein
LLTSFIGKPHVNESITIRVPSIISRSIFNDMHKHIGNFLNEKLFREQLCYFDDIDYREIVEFIGRAIHEQEIKDFLTEVAMTPF